MSNNDRSEYAEWKKFNKQRRKRQEDDYMTELEEEWKKECRENMISNMEDKR